MSSADTIFREYRISDAERSDRSAGDRLRHRQKVRESIRENIADIIAEESIIGKDKDRVIKVPLRGIKEYRFVFGDNAPGASQGDGDSRPGQVVGKTGKDGPGKGDERAGDRPGVDYYETDVTLEELIEIMFEDLELPNLERRALREIQSDYSTQRKGYRKVGIRIRLDKRRTAKQRVMRMLASDKRNDAVARALEESKADRELDADVEGVLDESALEEGRLDEEALAASTGTAFQRVHRRFPFHQDDLRYKHVEIDTKEESNAAVICIMDTSGSMDTMKKYLARSFFFLLYQFISTRYRNVEIVFIAHHTRGQRGHRGGVLPQGRIGRHLHLIRLRQGAGNHRRALPSVAVEHLRLPLLGRRQLRLRQSRRAQGRRGTRRDLQLVRLRRDQAAGLALLRIFDAQRVPPNSKRRTFTPC